MKYSGTMNKESSEKRDAVNNKIIRTVLPSPKFPILKNYILQIKGKSLSIILLSALNISKHRQYEKFINGKHQSTNKHILY